jgi:hypothetical protein
MSKDLTMRSLATWILAVTVLSACGAKSAKKPQGHARDEEVIGAWKLAGLKWKGEDQEINPEVGMAVGESSVTFTKPCVSNALEATTPAVLGDGVIDLLQATDTSCERDGSEVWTAGRRAFEIQGDTMKLYPENEASQGYWLWRR